METIKAANEEIRDDVVSIDLPAPHGWKKKFTPKKGGTQGGTPRRKEIVFISPTGEDIKNKRQLDQYLKSHPGGLSASEFDWGTGSTPRRSARLSELSKATESPESEPPKKAQKKSSSKKGEKEKDDIDGKGDTAEEMEAAKEEITGSAEVEMKDAEVTGDHTEGEDASTDKNNLKGSQPKTVIEIGDVNKEKPENEGATNGTSCAKEDEEGNNKSLLMAALEENTEAETEQALPEDPSQVPEKEWAASEAPCGVPVSNETASSVQAENIEGDAAASEGADVKKTENKSKNAKDGQEDQPNNESAPTEKVIDIEEDKNDKGSLKSQEAGIPAENYSASQGEAPHEPKSPQVSC